MVFFFFSISISITSIIISMVIAVNGPLLHLSYFFFFFYRLARTP